MALLLWIVILAVYVIPFYYVIVNSLKSEAEATVLSLLPPSRPHFENFLLAFREGHMLRGLANSFIVAGATVAIVIVSGALAAFYIQRARTRLANLLYYLFIAGIALPISVVTTFGLLQKMHLLNRLAGVSFVYSAMRIPFVVFLFVGFLKTVPRELDEAAIMDGCGYRRLFFQIIMPLLKPVAATAVVLTAQFVWNHFDVVLYFIQSFSKYTVPLSIYSFAGMHTSRWNLIFAGSIITVLPVLALYLVGQRYIVSGLTSGAVKY